MRVFNILFSIRKGLGPEWMDKNFVAALDDLPDDLTETEIKVMAVNQIEETLYKSEDYYHYGKNWTVKEINEG